MRRRGSTFYLVVVVTAILFFLVVGVQEIARTMLAGEVAAAWSTVAWHAADGGLEQGAARVAAGGSADGLHYSWRIDPHRRCEVVVCSLGDPHRAGRPTLVATATVWEESRAVAVVGLRRDAGLAGPVTRCAP